MKRLLIYIVIASTVSVDAVGQTKDDFDEFRDKILGGYSSFQRTTMNDYQSFRDSINEEYADFLENTWRQFHGLLPKVSPIKDKPIPPMPYKEGEGRIKDKELPYVDIVPIAPPAPQPKPVEPIKDQPQPIEERFAFRFYGTEGQVRLDNDMRFSLTGTNENHVADAWRRLSGEKKFDNVIRDCLELRIRYGLCDWAYLQMLKELGTQFCGANTNESTLLMAYLYCQSGYKMRIGRGESGRLYLMVASRHCIYGIPYFQIAGEDYYPLDYKENSLYICEASFPKEQPLSLWIAQETKLANKPSDVRTLKSKRYPQLNVTIQGNRNLIDFYNSYPTSQVGEDFMTRWAMYANTPLTKGMKDSLYPALRNAIQGKSQQEAANMLLNFVQTAFVYEYDDKVWGDDRAFFAEESLYYPYCDCEDRSILFSRLVRDLLDLKVVLVYYPGHLATAVHFTDYITGDYILLNNQRFTVCDPTYIGAPVGATMPNMNNGEAKVILLE